MAVMVSAAAPPVSGLPGARGMTVTMRARAVHLPSKLSMRRHSPRHLRGCRSVAPIFPTGPTVTSRRMSWSQSRLATKAAAFSANRFESKAEATSMDPKVRQTVERAIEDLGFRVTAGDVAAQAGLSVDTAASALNAISADSQGALEVSSSGDIVYMIPTDFKSRLAGLSWRIKMEPVVAKAQSTALYLTRVAFGTTLILSVVTVWAAITVILSSSRNNDDRRGGGYGGGYHAHTFINFADIFWYWDPYYYRTSSQRRERGEEMSFLEGIFSFVFGDGDPNAEHDDKRWAQLGRLIAARGGVVTAEEMAPFLVTQGVSSRDLDADSDESFVLPALVKFGGQPEVTEEGEILYRFPDLQVRASKVYDGNGGVPLEETSPFTRASKGQAIGAVFLGVLNAVGVGYLGALLQNPHIAYNIGPDSVALLLALLPVLKTYATCYFLIPLARTFFWWRNNNKANDRNQLRQVTAAAVNRPSFNLKQKMLKAAKLSKEGQKTLKRQDSIFRTDRGALEQQIEMEK